MHTCRSADLVAVLAAGLLVVGLGLVSGCSPLQTVNVRTDPPGATIVTVHGTERRRRGTAPVRFEVRGDQSFAIEARYPDHQLATVNVPGRDLDAELDLVLRPTGRSRDRLAVLEQLLIHGPLDGRAIARGHPSLDLDRVYLAMAELLRSGEVRLLRGDVTQRRRAPGWWARMFPILDGVFAIDRGAVVDLTMRGVRHLARSFAPETVEELLLASRVGLFQRWDRAEALLDRDRDRRR